MQRILLYIDYFQSNSTPTVTDLFQDLRDGVILLRLLEILTGNEYVCKPKKKKKISYSSVFLPLEKRNW